MNLSSLNAPTKLGMIQDNNLLSQSPEGYLYALNGSIEDVTGESRYIQNTASNVLATIFPNGFKVIGFVEVIEQDRVIYVLINPTTGESLIGETINCIYNQPNDKEQDDCSDCGNYYQDETTPLELKIQTQYCQFYIIQKDSCFNFNINYPVDIEYKLTDCDLRIYFTDALNQRRFLYFNYVNDNPSNNLIIQPQFYQIIGFDINNCNNPIYGTSLNCNNLLYHPTYLKPCIGLNGVVIGGELKAGVYQFMIAYSDYLGNPLTIYTPGSQTIPIFSTSNIITIATDYQTDKAISISISNLDYNTYQYYNLVVAKTINNFTSFELIGTFPTNPINQVSNVISYIYTGNEKSLIQLTANDILFSLTYYNTAKSVTKSNNYLFFSDLKEFKKPNLQQCGRLIKLYWETVAIPEEVYFEPENNFSYRTYQRDEVYAFGLVIEWAWGDYSLIHIPGRVATPNDLVEYNNNDDVIPSPKCTNILINKQWQIYNTGSLLGVDHIYTQNCNDLKTWEWGDFAYWESSEVYPNDQKTWGIDCGQPIRHHKFPDSSITHIHDGLNSNKQFFDNNIVFPIGVRIDNNSINYAFDWAVQQGLMTQEQRNQITGYRLIRGNRVGNKSVVAKGLLYDMWQYSKFNNTYYYPNYPYNDLRPDNFISNTIDTYQGDNDSSPIPISLVKTNRYTFHSPDTSFTTPALGDILKLETEEYGYSEGFFNECELQAKFRILSTIMVSVAFNIGLTKAFSIHAGLHRDKTVSHGAFIYPAFEGIATGLTFIGPEAAISTGRGGSTNFLGNYENFSDIVEGKYYPYGYLTGAADYAQALSGGVKETVQSTSKGTPFQLMSPIGGLAADVGILGTIASSLQVLLGFFNQFAYLVAVTFQEMQIWIDLFKTFLPYKNYGIQYNSIGKYNGYTNVPNYQGIKQRYINNWDYLEPYEQYVNDIIDPMNNITTSVRINNWNRESSVYLNLKGGQLPDPKNQDQSRVQMNTFGFKAGKGDLNKKVYAPISSYYGSIKNYVPDQYGNIFNIEYLETKGCSISLDTVTPVVFGGDTFINRFAFKKKVPFFLNTTFKQIDEIDIKYSDLGNIGYPNYYFDTVQPLGDRISDLHVDLLWPFPQIKKIYSEVIGVQQSRLDAKTPKFFYQNGYIHLFNYGIPYFFAESDVNVDYRYAENNLERDFYPHNSDLNSWLQEKNVPISFDNFYFYNKTYSKQNKESILVVDRPTKTSYKDCKVDLPNTIIYSLQDNLLTNNTDPWLIFKANDKYNFPLTDGRLISADGIESDKVLVRLENKMSIFNAYNVLQVDVNNIQVGTGGIFQTRPQDFYSTTLGYAGTQSKAFLRTEHGHVWVDAKRGEIFNLAPNGQGLEEISAYGMKNWFNENLQFKLQKDFPAISIDDLDNPFNNIGLSLCYDKRYDRIFLTKLDYKVIDSNVKYDPTNKNFYIDAYSNIPSMKYVPGQEKIVVSVLDKKYFCDKSWTLSYNFQTKSWVSFHSFKPNYYVLLPNYFQSGIQKDTIASVWSHNLTNKSYQVYYGKLEPFIIEYVSKPSVQNSFLTSINYQLDVVRYHNEYDYFYNRLVTFNKAIIYNKKQCSGLLELIPRNESNLFEQFEYPKTTGYSTQILTTNSENFWNINDFNDLVKSEVTNAPFFLNTCANDNKHLNQKALNYNTPDLNRSIIKDLQCRVRLINDQYSNYKFIFLFSNIDLTDSKR
jgi:hypothetical protein